MCHRFLTAFLSFPPLLTASSFIHRAAGLLLIRSPKFSRDFGFLWFCSRTKRFYKHPNPNHNHNPEAIHNPNHNPNPSPKQSNSFLTNLSRDQNRFLPINFQGSIFTLRHGGRFRISVQKYTDPDHFHTLRTFSQEFS